MYRPLTLLLAFICFAACAPSCLAGRLCHEVCETDGEYTVRNYRAGDSLYRC
ncbi:MAG: hypothetical protein ACJAYU_001937 [Bradymonadia bacterium]|jgi:hypothetical protein